MGRLAFGTWGRGPAVWLMDLDSGETLPIPTPLNRRYAFDRGLGRRGWVAAQVGYQVGAFIDGGDLLAPVLLPQAWSIYPAVTDELILLRRYFGRSTEDGEQTRVMVVGADAHVYRSMCLPWPFDGSAPPEGWRVRSEPAW